MPLQVLILIFFLLPAFEQSFDSAGAPELDLASFAILTYFWRAWHRVVDTVSERETRGRLLIPYHHLPPRESPIPAERGSSVYCPPPPMMNSCANDWDIVRLVTD